MMYKAIEIAKKIIAVLGVLFCLSCLFSCRTVRNIEYRDRYIDRYITTVVHDTLRENTHDSIYYEVIERNETVFATKYKERVLWKERIVEKRDTCYKDSIITEYRETTKEVKYIPKIYRISLAFSIFVITFAAIMLYLKFKKKVF